MINQINFYYLATLLAVVLYISSLAFWLKIRALKEQCKDVQKASDDREQAVRHLKQVCDQSRFEVEWLQNTIRHPGSAIHLLETFKRWSPSSEAFCGWVIFDNGSSVGTQIVGAPKELDKQRPQLSQCMILNRFDHHSVFQELPEVIERLILFAVEHCGSNSFMIAVSHIPECFSKSANFPKLHSIMQTAKCHPQSVPEKLVEIGGDLENQIAKEMLEIRSLLDNEFQTPTELMQGFLHKLTVLSGYNFASLYLNQTENAKPWEHFASGGTLSSHQLFDRWLQAESSLLSAFAGQLEEMLILNLETLETFDEDVPFRCGIMIPVRQGGMSVGALILTHHDATHPSNECAQLIEWASQFLMQTLDREISRVDTVNQARRDPLTNLANRRTFDAELKSAAARTKNGGEICSLIMLDIDHFKSINDTYGHQVGDQVIKEIAATLQALSQNLRVTDHVLPARYGGEEFAMVLPGVDLQGALRIAEQLREEIEQLGIAQADGTIRVTSSLGVACSDRHGKNSEELLHYADEALYEAKKAGRNQVCSIRLKVLNSQAT